MASVLGVSFLILWARGEGPLERWEMYFEGDCGETDRNTAHTNGRKSF